MQAASYDPGLIENTFFKIYITHLATKQMVDFRGWVTEFSDQYTSAWNKETVYGRMDPLATFQNTEREISIGFDVVSGDAGQAMKNLARINSLISFLYPVYESTGRDIQNTLKASPLLGMRWTNLAADINDGSQLIGFLAGVQYAPDLNQGGFLQSGKFVQENIDSGTFPGVKPGGKAGTAQGWRTDKRGSSLGFLPKVVSLSLSFTVLHKHLTGWSESKDVYRFGDGKGAKFPNANNVVIPGESQNLTRDFTDEGVKKNNPIQRSISDDILGTGGS